MAWNTRAFWRNISHKTDYAIPNRIDFKIIFNKVPHNKLIYKLQSWGLNSNVVNWIRDFVSDQEQKVDIDSISFDMITVTFGVPQRSVIGPLLFIIYKNDLYPRVSSQIRSFADDAAICREITDDTDAGIISSDLKDVKLCC
jgi:hypothetical protein